MRVVEHRTRGTALRRASVAVLAGLMVCTLVGLTVFTLHAQARTTFQPVSEGRSSCALRLSVLTAPGCSVVFSDSGLSADPAAIWGSIDCETAWRVGQAGTGGDQHLTNSGAVPTEGAYRPVKVLDGDDFWGERCELGRNGSHAAPNVLYREGQRRVTFASFRLPSSFPLAVNTWQVVMQMKQTQPADNGSGTPVLALNVFGGRWRLMQSTSRGPSSDTRELWSAPAQSGIWTRFAFDVRYSQRADRGWVKAYVDLNGDRDAADSGEQSPRINTYTLKRETAGTLNDGLAEGASIPSHLRAGIYHNPTIACPSPTGCGVDLDNVVVVAP